MHNSVEFDPIGIKRNGGVRVTDLAGIYELVYEQSMSLVLPADYSLETR